MGAGILFIRRGVFLALFLFLGSASAVYAADLRVEASTDRANLAVGEQLLLTIQIEGEVVGSLPAPPLPSHEGFELRGLPQQSSSFSWVNGKVTSSKTIRYRLLAKSEGQYRIGETSVSFRGDVYNSNPIEVVVEKAALPEGSGEELSVEGVSSDPSGRIIIAASLNKDLVYMGEGVVYTFSFLRKVRLWETPEYRAPEFTDFWVEDLPREGSPREVIVKGQRYLREDIKKVLFPTREGYLPIDSSAISVQLDPFANPIHLTTKPLELEVFPLPFEPEGFNGAVGNFTITANIGRRKLKEGEPLTVKVDIAGVGNVKVLRPPLYEEPEFFRGYEPKDSFDITTMNNLISGTKTFEFLFVPLKPGTLKVPVFSLTFFDPETERYNTISTEEIDVSITESERGIVVSNRKNNAYEGEGSSVPSLRPLRMKSDLGNWNPGGYLRGGQLFLLIVPPFVFLFLCLMQRLPMWFRKTTDAETEAMSELKHAQELLSENKFAEAFDHAASALIVYVKIFAGHPAGSMSNKEILELLLALGCTGEAVAGVRTLLDKIDMGRFSPSRGGAEDVEQFLADVKDMIENLKSSRAKGGK